MKEIKVSNTGPSSRSTFWGVRVYVDGERVVEYELKQHGPLNYIRAHRKGMHFQKFKAKCAAAGISEKRFYKDVLGDDA